MLFGIVIVVVLLIGGFIGLQATFMNQDAMSDVANQQRVSACESTLDTIANSMNVGETRDIPDNCFAEGELITDRLSNATKDDKFRKTENGLETVQ